MKKFICFLLAAVCCAGLATAEAVAQEYTPVPVSISKEKTRINGQVYYTHIVLERQTLYSISKAYGVTIDEIYEANPAVKQDGLKKNSILLIPVASASPQSEAPAQTAVEQTSQAPVAEEAVKTKKTTEKTAYFTHTVKWYEDLDTISKKYGVPVSVIKKVNGLSGDKLKNRQKLKIPADPAAYADEAAEETVTEVSSTAVAEAQETEKAEDDKKGLFSLLFPKSEVQVSLLLPLNATNGTGSENNMDFYSGALLAARDLGLSGINIDLNVYDMRSSELRSDISRISSSDVIIGPVSTGDLNTVLNMVSGNVPVVSPLDPRADALVSSHSNFIQAPPVSGEQYADLIDWVKEEKGPFDRTLAIFEKGLAEAADSSRTNTMLRESGINWSKFAYSILEGRNVLSAMEGLLNKAAVNRVLIVSESEAFVNDVVRNLNLMKHDGYEIVLYGTSKIRGFETINAEDFHNINLHVSMSYHVDYESEVVRDFIKKYRALYNTEPGAFAYQGYDIMHYFVTMCSKYGNSWYRALEQADTVKMLQADFKFARKGEGGYENTALRRIIYEPDFAIKTVD